VRRKRRRRQKSGVQLAPSAPPPTKGSISSRLCSREFTIWAPGSNTSRRSDRKAGKGIIPVDGEKLAKPEAYGSRSAFRLSSDRRTKTTRPPPSALVEKRRPALSRAFREEHVQFGQEFFPLEIAPTVAGR